ncbi:MAG: hypothetical protein KF791_17135 [Verrucomicrobiae bacterium]|nr:hypothetical protein [Verrucomicrobiae bacterium]
MKNDSPSAGLLLAVSLTLLGAMQAQDVSAVTLFRTANYVQSTVDNVAPEPPEDGVLPYTAFANMEMTDDFLSDPDNLLFVRGVTLQPPSGPLRTLQFVEFYGGFTQEEGFQSADGLENAYRAGTYRFTFGSLITGDQIFQVPVAEQSLLTPARVTNFDAAQQVDPGAVFPIQWSPPAPEDGGVSLEIWDLNTGDLVFELEQFDTPATSALIPAGLLQPGRDYEVELILARRDFEDDSALPHRLAATLATTRLPLRTTSGGSAAPVITSITLDPAGALQLVVTCRVGIALELEQSATPESAWSPLQSVVPDVSPATLTLPAASLPDVAFLRVVQ